MARELRPFERIVRDLYLEGMLTTPLKHGTNFYTLTPGKGLTWAVIAREIAQWSPGYTQVTGNKTGVIWVNGKDGPHGVLLEPGEWQRTKSAIEVAEELTGDKMVRCYSQGKACREMLKWAAVPHLDKLGKSPKSVEKLLTGIDYGYHACVPGKYEHLVMYDVSAYYYTLLCRLESLRVNVDNDGVYYEGMTSDEREKWAYLLIAIRDNKPLRNSIAGVCAGSSTWKPFWCYDKDKGTVVRKHRAPKAGYFRGAGLLVVHTGYQLCKANHLTTGSVYATIDCVTTPGDKPSLWDRLGFKTTIKEDRKGNQAIGPGEICQRSVYSIGPVSTELYKAGHRLCEAVNGDKSPPVDYSQYLIGERVI